MDACFGGDDKTGLELSWGGLSCSEPRILVDFVVPNMRMGGVARAGAVAEAVVVVVVLVVVAVAEVVPGTAEPSVCFFLILAGILPPTEPPSHCLL